MGYQQMSELEEAQKKALPTIAQAINKNALILALFAMVSTGLIAITHHLTKEKIALETELALVRQLSQIVPKENYTNNVYNDCIIVTDTNLLGGDAAQKLYRMRNNKQNYAVMMTTVAPDGYSGKINLAIATDQNGELIGVNVLSHSETPGLGDKIERNKSNWLNQFNQRSLKNTDDFGWGVRKDGGQFDALTGATITPRAVINAVQKGLMYFQSQQSELFELKSNCYEGKGTKK